MDCENIILKALSSPEGREALVKAMTDNLVNNITHIENLPSLNPYNCQFGKFGISI